MKKPIVALVIATAALGSIAAYLLHSLDAERAQVAQREKPADGVVELPGLTLHTRTTTSVATPGASPGAAPTARAMQAARENRHPAISSDEDHATRQRKQAAEYLRRHDDPVEGAELRQQELDRVRRSLAGIEQKLGLDPEKFERLVRLVAEGETEKRVASARCIGDPLCLRTAMSTPFFSERDQQIRDIVGDEHMKDLRSFRNAEQERKLVDTLQKQMPATLALSESQAGDLALAIFDERQKQQHEMQVRQQRVRGYGLGNGFSLFYAANATTAEAALQSGEQYVQAMRDRAATVLQGDQLAAFNRNQDDLLIGFRRFVNEQIAPLVSASDGTP